jgi:hypothetical protein
MIPGRFAAAEGLGADYAMTKICELRKVHGYDVASQKMQYISSFLCVHRYDAAS